MKQILSHMLFWAGDKVSKTSMRYQWQFDLYQWFMRKSLDLDSKGEVWK